MTTLRRWTLEEVPQMLMNEIEEVERALRLSVPERMNSLDYIGERICVLRLNQVWVKYLMVGTEGPAKSHFQQRAAGWIEVIGDLIELYMGIIGFFERNQ